MYEKYISWKKVKMTVWKYKLNLVIGIELFTVGLNFEETSKEEVQSFVYMFLYYQSAFNFSIFSKLFSSGY